MIAIVIACTIAWGGLNTLLSPQGLIFAVVLFFTIGIAFIAHEMGHKWAAGKCGAASRFVMWPAGILLMLAMSPLGFIFAAPGAVYILKPYLTKRESGLISLAGPSVNFVLYLFFALLLVLSAYAGLSLSDIVKEIALLGLRINSFLAFFNLLPLFVLDGAKVWHWNGLAWGAAFLVSILAMVLAESFVIFI